MNECFSHNGLPRSFWKNVIKLVVVRHVRSAKMRPVATVVVWTVCVSVGHSRELC